MNHFHAVCWMDHNEARVFHFDAHDFERTTIHPDKPNRHLHNKRAPEATHGDKHFHEAVARALADAREILLMGPGQAKVEFRKFLDAHARDTAKRIVASEQADHPTDGEIVAHARKHFKAIDRMTPQLT
ncbi:MAG: translational machinery protein [Azospirillum sp.]|nr:translational machinery protein [Azospirillum sp.]